MKKNVLLAFVSFFLVSAMLMIQLITPVAAYPAVIKVPDDYPTIQEAINAANPGDTIIVSSGLYAEGQINVTKSLTLLADGGVLVDGLGKGHVFYVNETAVTIEGFTVRNSKIGFYAGITLENVQNCTISRNIITDNWGGVSLSLSDNNIIVGNEIADNTVSSISLSESSNNKLVNNTLTGDGVSLYKSSNNTISGNTVTTTAYGVSLTESSNNMITNNTLKDTLSGVSLSRSNKNTISGNTMRGFGGSIGLDESSNNTITANDSASVHMTKSSNNKLRNNNMTDFGVTGEELSHFINDIDTSNTVDGKPVYYWINKSDMMVPSDAGYVVIVNSTSIVVKNLDLTDNFQGIVLAFTTNSSIKNNGIGWNHYGIWLYVSNDNTIYHNNFINNLEQVYSVGSTNIWDDGYPLGGNYWSDYEAVDEYSGPSQDQPGSDGIGDYEYVIDLPTHNQDEFPLMAPIKLFDAGAWNGVDYYVDITSNSTVSNFQLNVTLKKISFNITGETGLGFSRVTIPNVIVQDLWEGNYTVLVDGEAPLDIRNWTDTENTYIYFTYQHSEHEVIIIPEFPTWASILTILTVLTAAITIYKRRLLKTPIH